MPKANVHPKIVSERLGHASIATTADIYGMVTYREKAKEHSQYGPLNRLSRE